MSIIWIETNLDEIAPPELHMLLLNVCWLWSCKATGMVDKPLANPFKAAGVAASDLSSSVVNDTVTIKMRFADITKNWYNI